MYVDIVDLRSFYAERLGLVARRLIGRRIKEFWPSVDGLSLVGIGYASPYLGPYRAEAERTLAFMPAAQGVVNWPASGPNVAALVLDDDFPLPDSSVDRVIVVHCLEMAQNPGDVLREIWRVLTPGGRAILVVPNRRGLWAHVEATPFGSGSPFSRTQLTALLRETMFSPLHWAEALSLPPLSRQLIRTGTNWERIGAALWPGFGGVLIVEATKLLYRGIPAKRKKAGRLTPSLRPALIPPPASARDSTG
jgi:SAM-dependent methyltransferase